METGEMNGINTLTLKLAVMSYGHTKGYNVNFDEASKNYYSFTSSLAPELRVKYLSNLVKRVKDHSLAKELGYNYQFYDVVAYDLVRLNIANENKFPFYVDNDGALVIHEKKVVEVKAKKRSSFGSKIKRKTIVIRPEDIQFIGAEKPNTQKKVKEDKKNSSDNKQKVEPDKRDVQARLKWLIEEKERLEKLKQERERIKKARFEKERRKKAKFDRQGQEETKDSEKKDMPQQNAQPQPTPNPQPQVNNEPSNLNKNNSAHVKENFERPIIKNTTIVRRSREEILADLRRAHGLKTENVKRRPIPPRKSSLNNRIEPKIIVKVNDEIKREVESTTSKLNEQVNLKVDEVKINEQIDNPKVIPQQEIKREEEQVRPQEKVIKSQKIEVKPKTQERIEKDRAEVKKQPRVVSKEPIRRTEIPRRTTVQRVSREEMVRRVNSKSKTGRDGKVRPLVKNSSSRSIYKPQMPVSKRNQTAPSSLNRPKVVNNQRPNDQKITIKSTFEIKTKDKSTVVRQTINGRGVPTKNGGVRFVPISRNRQKKMLDSNRQTSRTIYPTFGSSAPRPRSISKEERRRALLKKRERVNSKYGYEAYMN